MRYLFICFLGLLASDLQAQKINCKSIRVGTFVSNDDVAGSTVITRTETMQREVNEKFGIITEDSVKWLNDCKYKLIKSRVIKNESKVPMELDLKLEIEILEVKQNSYVQRITSGVTGESMTFEIKRVK